MYAWGKKGKMLVFTGVYVCVKAKLTLVSFFLPFFLHLSLIKTTNSNLQPQAPTACLCGLPLGLAMPQFLLMRIDAHQMRIDAHIPHQ